MRAWVCLERLITLVRATGPTRADNLVITGQAGLVQLRCDASPLATRPSAGYVSFLVTVAAAIGSKHRADATLSVVSHARMTRWDCARGWNSDRMARLPQRIWGGPCVPSRMGRAICPRSLDKTSVPREGSRARRVRHARVRGPAANLYEKR